MTLRTPPSPRRVAASQALHWVAEGWRLFAARPLIWLVIALVSFSALAILSVVPLVGRVLAMVVLQVLAGGMVAAADHLRERGELHVAELFEGFRQHAGNLAIVGLLFGLALTMAGILTVIVTLIASAIARIFSHLPFGIDMLVQALFADWLITAAVTLVVMLGLWFAPALVMLDRRPPFEAMRASFAACIANPGATAILAALLVFGVPTIVTLSLGFGVLLVIPLVATTAYASYRDVFAAEPAPLHEEVVI
ncbi:BPSS1780 family membrane protein [Niveibacterium sp. SC-1]|uniref:BPSS1780 family membrane protein n=1 Tax=Niveibacterium sp. SC-1 TaxID=3135646 RepID=UPI00311F0B3B